MRLIWCLILKSALFCLNKLCLRHFCRECRKNLNIRILKTKFWVKSACEDAPQVVPACYRAAKAAICVFFLFLDHWLLKRFFGNIVVKYCKVFQLLEGFIWNQKLDLNMQFIILHWRYRSSLSLSPQDHNKSMNKQFEDQCEQCVLCSIMLYWFYSWAIQSLYLLRLSIPALHQFCWCRIKNFQNILVFCCQDNLIFTCTSHAPYNYFN